MYNGYTIALTADWDAYERGAKFITEELGYEQCCEHDGFDVFWSDYRKGDSRIRLEIDEFIDYVGILSYDELQIDCLVKWKSREQEELRFDD